jgi:hypothetical protein
MCARVTIYGNISSFLTLDGLSAPRNLTQRIYRWGDCIATYRSSLPWDQQLHVERRTPVYSVRTDDQLYYMETTETTAITSIPMTVDDVYDENVTMYTIHSHITMLEMKNMFIFTGPVSELCKLPFTSEVISSLNKQVVLTDSCRLVQPRPDSLQLTPPQSSPPVQRLAETSHVQRQHQSRLQSREGRQHPPRHEPRGAHVHQSHDRPRHGRLPLQVHASHHRESGGYVPRMQGGAQTGSTRPLTQQRPTNHVQYHQLHPSAPLSRSVQRQPAVTRRPEFVPEDS